MKIICGPRDYNPQTTTQRRPVVCQAGSTKIRRQTRIREQAAAIEETLSALEAASPIATYDLQLSTAPRPSTKTINLQGSNISSSSSTSSVSDEDRRPNFSPPTITRPAPAPVVSVCQGKACKKRSSDRVLAALQQSPAALEGRIDVKPCKCLDQCKRGPCVKVQEASGDEMVYVGVKDQEAAIKLARLVLRQ